MTYMKKYKEFIGGRMKGVYVNPYIGKYITNVVIA